MQVFSALFLVVGLLLFMYKEKTYCFYVMFWLFFFPFVVNLGFKLQTDTYYNILAWCNYYNSLVFLFLVCHNLKKPTVNKWIWGLLAIIVLLFAYSAFLAKVRNTDYVENIKYMYSNFSNVFFLINLFLLKPSLAKIRKWAYCIFVIELIIAFFQMLGFFQYSVRQDEGMANLSIITGTFIRNNIFAEVLTILFLFLLYFQIKINEKITKKYWAFTILVFYLVYESGIRTALLAFVLAFGCLYFFRPTKLPYLKTKLALFAFLLMLCFNSNVKSILSGEMTYDSQVTSSADRQANLLNIFRDKDYLSENTTIYYSIFVLSYFEENPVLGPGLLYSNCESGYGNLVNTKSGNLTDATLAIYCCETGIIGIALFLALYYVLLFKINENRKGALILFLYLFLITITDPGLFFLPNTCLFYTLIYFDKVGFKRYKKYEISKRFKTLSQSCI